MLKLLHIASGDLWAGAEVQLYNLACELNSHEDIQLKVILLNHGELELKLQQKGVNVLVIDETKHGALTILKKIVMVIHVFNPDVVHTHRTKENILGSIAAKICNIRTCVRTAHGLSEFKSIPWRLDKLAIKYFDYFCGRWLQNRIIAVSYPLAQRLILSYPKRMVTTIENGINLYEVLEKSQLPIPAPLPGRQHRTRICIVCRLTSVKRLDIFIAIAKEVLKENNTQYDFYIFGAGPLEKWVHEEIIQSKLTEYVYMMGFQDNIPSYLVHMDYLLITSDHEGLPMNLLEALSLDLNVISRSIGPIPELLKMAGAGFIVNGTDPHSYASIILSTKKPEKNSKTMPYIRNNLDIKICANQYISLYTKHMHAAF